MNRPLIATLYLLLAFRLAADDLDTDPHEIRNLAALPEYRERLQAFRATLNDWMKNTGDLGGIEKKN